MLNAIKRTWVPKNAAAQAPSPVAAKAAEPIAPAAPLSIYAGLSLMFDDLPTPQAEEINGGDSIWAVFEEVQPMSAAR
jgi:hypothetical protein